MDLLKPEYNILPIAGSRFGSKHSEETKAKQSAARKGRVNTAEHKAKLLEGGARGSGTLVPRCRPSFKNL